jgi:hypothetical protein
MNKTTLQNQISNTVKRYFDGADGSYNQYFEEHIDVDELINHLVYNVLISFPEIKDMNAKDFMCSTPWMCMMCELKEVVETEIKTNHPDTWKLVMTLRWDRSVSL